MPSVRRLGEQRADQLVGEPLSAGPFVHVHAPEQRAMAQLGALVPGQPADARQSRGIETADDERAGEPRGDGLERELGFVLRRHPESPGAANDPVHAERLVRRRVGGVEPAQLPLRAVSGHRGRRQQPPPAHAPETDLQRQNEGNEGGVCGPARPTVRCTPRVEV